MLLYRRRYNAYGQEDNIEPIAEAIGPYDTEPEAMAAAEEQVRRMVGQGFTVDTYYAVQREDGLWDAVIEYVERRQAAPPIEEKSNLGYWVIGGLAASLGLGAILWGVTR